MRLERRLLERPKNEPDHDREHDDRESDVMPRNNAVYPHEGIQHRLEEDGGEESFHNEYLTECLMTNVECRSCHPDESRGPAQPCWIPAFAGMT